MVNGAFLRFIQTGKIRKIETLFVELGSIHAAFSFGVELHQYTPVLAQNVVHIADVVGLIAVQFVVITNAALVGTKFFICPAFNFITTLQTNLFFSFRHDFGGFIGFYIRL
jgi:hypothetical protein